MQLQQAPVVNLNRPIKNAQKHTQNQTKPKFTTAILYLNKQANV